MLKNWCFQTVMLEKTLESPLDYKKIKSVHPKGNQPWLFIERTGAEAKVPILWPPDVKSWLIGKNPDAVKDWRQKEKRAAEDEMVGWHHWFTEHSFSKLWEIVKGSDAQCCAVHGVTKSWTQLKRLNNSNKWNMHATNMHTVGPDQYKTSHVLFSIYSSIIHGNEQDTA